MRVIEKIRKILNDPEARRTQGWLAEQLGVTQPTVNRWLGGSDPRGEMRDAINALFDKLYGDDPDASQASSVPLMGFLGAGAVVEPEFEQVPPEGLEEVSVPFPLPADMIAFKVRGVSMMPAYKDGATIIVYKEQRRPIEAFYGDEAAVRTSDGRRFIKTIIRGNPGVTLISWNAQPIENVHLEWIGQIFAVLPPTAKLNGSRR